MSLSFVVVDDLGQLVRPEHHIRSPFYRERFPTLSVGVSMTHQSHASSCDVNKIVERYARTGDLPPPSTQPVFADVTSLQGDLTELYARSARTIEIASSFVKGYKPSPSKEPPLSTEGVAPAEPGA